MDLAGRFEIFVLDVAVKVGPNLIISFLFLLLIIIFTRVDNFALCNIVPWRAFLGGANEKKKKNIYIYIDLLPQKRPGGWEWGVATCWICV